MSEKANDYQVAGTHYKTAYEHWDFTLAVGMLGLEYAATKYLSRYGKKGQPVADLEKVVHYIVKIRENASLCLAYAERTRPAKAFIHEQVTAFCRANEIVGHANGAIRLLSDWETTVELDNALVLVRALIKLARHSEPMPVPLEDSNKHADRQEQK